MLCTRVQAQCAASGLPIAMEHVRGNIAESHCIVHLGLILQRFVGDEFRRKARRSETSRSPGVPERNRSAEPVWTRGWPSQTAVGLRRNPCRLTYSACGGSAFFAARRASWLGPLQLVRALSPLRGFTRRPPVVGPPYRHGRTLTPEVSVRSTRYPAFRQSGKHRRTASRSGPGLSLCRDIRPVLAVDNASVRLARSHVHTGFTERLPPELTWTSARRS